MKIDKGYVQNMDRSKTAQIVADVHIKPVELIAGLLAVGSGICIIAKGAMKAGVDAFRVAEDNALREIGALK